MVSSRGDRSGGEGLWPSSTALRQAGTVYQNNPPRRSPNLGIRPDRPSPHKADVPHVAYTVHLKTLNHHDRRKQANFRARVDDLEDHVTVPPDARRLVGSTVDATGRTGHPMDGSGSNEGGPFVPIRGEVEPSGPQGGE